MAPPSAHRPARGVLRLGLPTLALALSGLLVACGAVEESARGLASEARAEGREQLDEAVRQRVDEAVERFGGSVDVDRLCELVADDRLTASERGRLSLAVDVAEALGLPADVVAAAEQVLASTDGATTRVEDLSAACREAGANLGGGG